MSRTQSISAKRRNPIARASWHTCEQLERRTLLSTILWTNKGTGAGAGDTDAFNATYGANATTARSIVQRAIDDWERVIVNFNYTGGGNTYSLTVNAGPISGRGVTNSITRNDAVQKKPNSAIITLDDNAQGGGWYFDSVIGSSTVPDDGEFTTLITPFAAQNATADNDLYRTIVHEIGHAMGLGDSSGFLKIGDFLSNGGADPNAAGETLRLLDFNGGGTDYTLTTDGGGHLFEGGGAYAGPVHPNDLMNDGRTVPLNTNIRELISNTDATLLRDVYGYTITLPSLINTFYANLNTTTNVLTVTGDINQNGSNVDNIDLEHSGSSTTIEANGMSEVIPDAQFTTMIVNAGAANDNIDVNALASGKTVTVNGGNEDDRIDVAQDTDDIDTNIMSDFTANGGAGVDTITFSDGLDGVGGDTYNVTQSIFTKNGRDITYNSFDLFQIFGSPQASTYTVSSTFSTTDYTISGGALADTFNVGTGSFDAIDADVSITGNGGADVVIVNDTADAIADTYQFAGLRFEKLNGLGSLTCLSTTESITINGSNAANDWSVPQISPSVDLIMNGGTGVDSFVGFFNNNFDVNVLSDITFNGGGGTSDSIIVNDQSSAGLNYFLDNNSLDKGGAGILHYGTTESFVLNCNGLDNDIEILSTFSSCPITVNGNGGNDQLSVNDGTSFLFNFGSDITFNGGSGTSDQVNITDTLYAGTGTYTITNGHVVLPFNNADVFFGTTESLSVNGSQGVNTINVNQTNIFTLASGDGGNDTINVGNGNFAANITDDVIVVGGDDADIAIIDDTVNAAGNTWTLTNSSITHSGATGSVIINFFGPTIDAVRIDAGAGSSIFNVNGTATGTPVTINGNNGSDLFNVGNGDWDLNLPSSVTLNGGVDAFADTVVINDTADTGADNYTVNSGSTTKSSIASVINYTSIERYILDANNAVNTITVNSAFDNYRVNGNGSADIIDVQGNQVGTFLTVDGGTALDTVRVNPDGLGTAGVQFVNSQDLLSLELFEGSTLNVDDFASDISVVTNDMGFVRGAFNLNDNYLVVRSSAGLVPFYVDKLTRGYNGGGWNGIPAGGSSGVMLSGTAAASALSDGVGYGQVGAAAGELNIADYRGTSVVAGDLIISYTLYGDTNLDRIVDINDLYNLGNPSNWLQAGRRWTQGNFNFDDLTNAVDLGMLSHNWQAALPGPALPVFSSLPINPTRAPTRAPVRMSIII